MTKENILFTGGLLLIVGALILICLWAGKSQPAVNRQTGQMKNPYLISAPPDAAEPSTQPTSEPAPAR